MTKLELIAAVAAAGQMNKVEAVRALEAVCTAINTALRAGEHVNLPDVGRFKVEDDVRHGLSLDTGEVLTVHSARRIKFTAVKALTEVRKASVMPASKPEAVEMARDSKAVKPS